MKVRIKQISEITGFSPATISNALNRKKGVNRETSAEIFRVAQELGYVTNNELQKIKVIIYRREGSFIDDNPFLSLIMEGAEEICRPANLEVAIHYLDKRHSDYGSQVEALLSEAGTGIVIVGSELEEEELYRFRGSHCPIVLIDYWCSDMSFNAVMINNEDAVAQAVDYLLQKGHTRIGYLRGKLRIFPFRGREASLRASLERHGLRLEDRYTATISSSVNGSYVDMSAYLSCDPHLPTAYFPDNDAIALGAMKAMKEHGLIIPHDISIIGVDDIPFSSIITPNLTTIQVQQKNMGRIAIEQLLEMTDPAKKSARHLTSKVVLSTNLLERDSVRDLTLEQQNGPAIPSDSEAV